MKTLVTGYKIVKSQKYADAMDALADVEQQVEGLVPFWVPSGGVFVVLTPGGYAIAMQAMVHHG